MSNKRQRQDIGRTKYANHKNNAHAEKSKPAGNSLFYLTIS